MSVCVYSPDHQGEARRNRITTSGGDGDQDFINPFDNVNGARRIWQ